MVDEQDVRNWIRSLSSAAPAVEIAWCEPNVTRGGPDGIEDVRITLGGELIGRVELKLWKRLRDGSFSFSLRRSQVRYHAVCAKRGVRTLLLWGCPGSDFVWCLPGTHAPETVTGRLAAEHPRIVAYEPWAKEAFLNDLAAGVFWN